MAQPLTVALPPNIVLWDGCQIRVTAIDPTTGATVSGVTVSAVSLEVEQLAGGDLVDASSGPFMLVPGPEA